MDPEAAAREHYRGDDLEARVFGALRGAEVDVVPVYETVVELLDAEQAAAEEALAHAAVAGKS